MLGAALHLLARQDPSMLPPDQRPTSLTESPYGYVPALPNVIAYLAVFSLLTLTHLGLGIKYKYYSAIVTMVAGGLLEVIGWAGRLWSNQSLLNWNPFIMQICCLILGPVFFSAWDYTILGFCIKVLGPQYSLIGPNWYLIIFIIADIISLVLQAVGGGGAAVQAQRFEDTTSNTRIMLAGILFQLGTTTIFLILAADFMWRVVARKPYSDATRRRFAFSCFKRKKASAPGSPNLALEKADDLDPKWIRRSQYLLLGVAWASVMIYIRGIYRSIELAQGWTGHLMTNEVYFVWLDGFMMVLCMAGLAVAHPGFLLPASGWS
ncbi:RTA1-domain-containing protein [Cutaneotrichosporon oleaginosum]|uniref:RTA1-domain-containing protein n=1 Tax=Cutaneotrichosporon oleaginosum TaxID=879819 RepID=A0A0J1AXC2_9TREE|nr:RTA1-domain-containing protein [Cutaneotrichosporon oleaginosum]KLT39954.1 RTA1-domain-containing protein [Cutaneotrichosporon oleaginosum]TXT08366.1 hypothetical protein COLE_05290 [Cutaneotrichosporon oleaginosum]